MGYPKRRSLKYEEWRMTCDTDIWNDCHDQFTEEIKERASVGNIVNIINNLPATDNQVIAEAISKHITKGV